MAFDKKDFNKALTFFEPLLKNREAEFYLKASLKAATCYFELQNYEKAYQLLLKIKNRKNYFNNPDDFKYIYAMSLVKKSKPDYSEAIPYLHQIINRRAHSKINIIQYYLAKSYEEKNKFEEAIIQYKAFLRKYPDDNNANIAKKALKTLEEKLKNAKPIINDYYNYYSYSIDNSNENNIVITITNFLDNCFLQKNGNPGLIFLPVNIEKVKLNQKLTIILEYTPFYDSRIAYLEVNTDVPRSNLNIFKPSVQIEVSQDYHCCKKGINKIIEKELFGIWGDGLTSSFKYSKPMKFDFTINSLGRSFQSSFGKSKLESPLQISIILGNSQNVVTSIINDAKQKGVNLLNISGF